MLVWGYCTAKWCFREYKSKAGVWSTSIIVSDPKLQNSTVRKWFSASGIMKVRHS